MGFDPSADVSATDFEGHEVGVNGEGRKAIRDDVDDEEFEGRKGVLSADSVDSVGAGEGFFGDEEGVDEGVMGGGPIDVVEGGSFETQVERADALQEGADGLRALGQSLEPVGVLFVD